MLKFPKPEKAPKGRRKGAKTSKHRKARKASMALCDRLFSRLVRTEGFCEGKGYVNPDGTITGCSAVLQCAHIVSRRYKAVRWSGANAVCLCSAHHIFFTYRPIEWRIFVNARFAKGYMELQEEHALQVAKPDYDAIAAFLREKLGEKVAA